MNSITKIEFHYYFLLKIGKQAMEVFEEKIFKSTYVNYL